MVRASGTVKIPAKYNVIIFSKLRNKKFQIKRDFMFILKKKKKQWGCIIIYRGCLYGFDTNHEYQCIKRLFI